MASVESAFSTVQFEAALLSDGVGDADASLVLSGVVGVPCGIGAVLGSMLSSLVVGAGLASLAELSNEEVLEIEAGLLYEVEEEDEDVVDVVGVAEVEESLLWVLVEGEAVSLADDELSVVEVDEDESVAE